MDTNISLSVYWIDQKPYVSASELFRNILPYSVNYYTHWVRINITEQPQQLPKKGRDYLFAEDFDVPLKEPSIKGGKKRKHYFLSISFARELCYQTKTIPANNVRDFLHKFI